jgi:hypothetical protein
MIVQAPIAIVLRGPNYIVEILNSKTLNFGAQPSVMNKPILSAMPEPISQGIENVGWCL